MELEAVKMICDGDFHVKFPRFRETTTIEYMIRVHIWHEYLRDAEGVANNVLHWK